MKRIHVFLTTVQIKRLQKLRKKLGGLPVSELIRRAVDEFLDKEGEK